MKSNPFRKIFPQRSANWGLGALIIPATSIYQKEIQKSIIAKDLFIGFGFLFEYEKIPTMRYMTAAIIDKRDGIFTLSFLNST